MATFPRRISTADRTLDPRRARLRPASIREALGEHTTRDVLVATLLNRDGERCYLCGDQLRPGAYEVEHIIARSRGGSDHLTNLALACFSCNRRKSDFVVSMRISDRMVVLAAS